MNHRGTDPENEVDPVEVESRLRLAVARLRDRLTVARNHGHFESLRRTRGSRFERPSAERDSQ
ncbi:hypothetical protein ABZ816_04085 [Actinosynnema sp. NPDC047251]|uniref:Uncharacterized protein n=1 Tax=Saccharothrix espanaensis (strain ATCC 51144 / DSM 44229 / JCM 9112 / NBRC 15066 / NRRL 15764) TaxID=1179773 RepID=K0JZ85_SACES|nr:hypothetical protein [Saccharothrix espanaensis]CCH31441.1 hypothetical protein BN6_41540 [Saccharothrix espanaensis DSM 44229]